MVAFWAALWGSYLYDMFVGRAPCSVFTQVTPSQLKSACTDNMRWDGRALTWQQPAELTRWDASSQIHNIKWDSWKLNFKRFSVQCFPVTALSRISGATYSGVPQMLLVLCFTYFDRPKSTILMWPLESRRIFSGLRSLEWLTFFHAECEGETDLYTMWRLWRYERAETTSAV